MTNEFQQPRLITDRDSNLYIAQFITPEDVAKFREVVSRDFPSDERLLGTFDEKERGSSIFGNIVMAKILLESGWEIADIPQIYDANRTFDANDGSTGLSTREHYSDGRLVIRAKNEATEHILDQVEDKELIKEGREGVLETPISLPLSGLELNVNGPMQDYSVELTPQAKVVASPQYSFENSEKRFSIFDENGNPILDKDGKYTIYNGEDDVAGACVGGELDLDNGNNNLRDSYSSSRIIKFRAKGTTKNLVDKLAEELKAKHTEELERLNEFRTSFHLSQH